MLIILCARLHVKQLVFLSDFNETWIFLDKIFEKNFQVSNFMKIHPAGAESFLAANFLENLWVPRLLSLGVQRPVLEL